MIIYNSGATEQCYRIANALYKAFDDLKLTIPNKMQPPSNCCSQFLNYFFGTNYEKKMRKIRKTPNPKNTKKWVENAPDMIYSNNYQLATSDETAAKRALSKKIVQCGEIQTIVMIFFGLKPVINKSLRVNNPFLPQLYISALSIYDHSFILFHYSNSLLRRQLNDYNFRKNCNNNKGSIKIAENISDLFNHSNDYMQRPCAVYWDYWLEEKGYTNDQTKNSVTEKLEVYINNADESSSLIPEDPCIYEKYTIPIYFNNMNNRYSISDCHQSSNKINKYKNKYNQLYDLFNHYYSV